MTNSYCPDYVSCPGEILEEILEERDISQTELAERVGLTVQAINEVIHGLAPITADIAARLEQALGTPAYFWVERERLYREHQSRQRAVATTTARYLQPGYIIQIGSDAITVSFVQEVVHPDRRTSRVFIYENGELVAAVNPDCEFELLFEEYTEEMAAEDAELMAGVDPEPLNQEEQDWLDRQMYMQDDRGYYSY